MARRKTTKLRDGSEVTRRDLVAQGRRLVIFDLGHAGEDVHLVQEHQEKYLGHLLGVQFHTWFKTVAQRAHNGWDQEHQHRLSNDERVRRLAIARGLPIGRMPTGETGAAIPAPHLAPAAASALRKRETVRTG